MTKLELVNAIAEGAGISKAAAKKALDAGLDAIVAALKKNDAVILPGFGSFKAALRAERKGINLRTKKPIIIPAAKVAKFKPGKELKEL
ncbi:MAG TPA: DNA-binding protein [Bacteroidales bacterium]|nr:DNA-binding protein [Bacteroidales bacterium]